jgi:hypothetical protein
LASTSFFVTDIVVFVKSMALVNLSGTRPIDPSFIVNDVHGLDGPTEPVPLQPFREETHPPTRIVDELSGLNVVARAIGALLNLQDIVHTIIHRSLRAVHAEQAVITLLEQRSNEPMRTPCCYP